MPVFLSRLSGFPLPAVLRGPLICKVPVQARFRSDKHAAVLRLQRTQPKDRRVYTALTGILAAPQAIPGRRKQGRAGISGRPRIQEVLESPPIEKKRAVNVIDRRKVWEYSLINYS